MVGGTGEGKAGRVKGADHTSRHRVQPHPLLGVHNMMYEMPVKTLPGSRPASNVVPNRGGREEGTAQRRTLQRRAHFPDPLF